MWKYNLSRKRVRVGHSIAARWINRPGWPEEFCLKLYPARS